MEARINEGVGTMDKLKEFIVWYFDFLQSRKLKKFFAWYMTILIGTVVTATVVCILVLKEFA